jgi:hypothetical protein
MARRWVALLALLWSLLGVTTTVNAAALTYEARAVAHVDVHRSAAPAIDLTPRTDALEGSALPCVEAQATSTTPNLAVVATEAVESRGALAADRVRRFVRRMSSTRFRKRSRGAPKMSKSVGSSRRTRLRRHRLRRNSSRCQEPKPTPSSGTSIYPRRAFHRSCWRRSDRDSSSPTSSSQGSASRSKSRSSSGDRSYRQLGSGLVGF